MTSGVVCPRRLTEKPSGYDPLDARSSRAGDTAAVAEMAMQRLVAPPDAGSSPVSRLNIMNWGCEKRIAQEKEGPQVHREPAVLLFVLKFNLR